MHDSVSNDDEDWQKIQEMMPGWIIVCWRTLRMFAWNYEDVPEEQKWSYPFFDHSNASDSFFFLSRDDPGPSTTLIDS